MPQDAVPFVAAIVAAFVFFMVVLGGVALWSSSPGEK